MKISVSKFEGLKQSLNNEMCQILELTKQKYQILVPDDTIIKIFNLDFEVQLFTQTAVSLPQIGTSGSNIIKDLLILQLRTDKFILVLLKSNILLVYDSLFCIITYFAPDKIFSDKLTPISLSIDANSAQYQFSIFYSTVVFHFTYKAFEDSIYKRQNVVFNESSQVQMNGNILLVQNYGIQQSIQPIQQFISYDLQSLQDSLLQKCNKLVTLQQHLYRISTFSGLTKISPLYQYKTNFIEPTTQVLQGMDQFKQKLTSQLLVQQHNLQFIVNQVELDNYLSLNYVGKYLIENFNWQFQKSNIQTIPQSKKHSIFAKTKAFLQQKQDIDANSLVPSSFKYLYYHDQFENYNSVLIIDNEIFVYRLDQFALLSNYLFIGDSITLINSYIFKEQLIIYQENNGDIKKCVLTLPGLILQSNQSDIFQLKLNQSCQALFNVFDEYFVTCSLLE
ncbi:hypothetical protein SS50377_25554 [Spironucleus salmonicida]|uniref:Uncharacterized protein n=1 Tax=Spironucleus salmonicida TaxID=348837 RepID=V6LKK3_9EUKA|nr:hypothetical protein SS50377_25554 [Spironucleus salmonicida]|eukprot:EST45102.1 Hypothetical protein SS50377_15122 [Spironucleus salmonicida]